MLYNPNWKAPAKKTIKKKTKLDPMSLESLVAWLEKQPADKTYSYLDNYNCVLAQYFKASGFTKVVVMGDTFETAETGYIALPPYFSTVPNGRLPFTFGYALETARNLLKKKGKKYAI